MIKNKVRFITALAIIAIMGFNLMLPINANAQEQESQEKVIVEALGFFSHYPMRPTLNVIVEVCEKFGDKVELTLYDETKADGVAFMKEKGLSGHIPMRLYINGSNTVTIDGEAISFSDFVNQAWTADELEKAITLALENPDAVQAESDASTENNVGALPGGMNYPLLIGISSSVFVAALIGFFLLKRKETVKGKAGGKQGGKRNVN